MGDKDGNLDRHARGECMAASRELHEFLRRDALGKISPPEYPLPHVGKLGELTRALINTMGYRHTNKEKRTKGDLWNIWWIDHAFAQWHSGLHRHAEMNWQERGASELDELWSFLQPVEVQGPDDERLELATEVVDKLRPLARLLCEQSDEAHLESTRLATMLKNRMTLDYGAGYVRHIESKTRRLHDLVLLETWRVASRAQRARHLHPAFAAELAVAELENLLELAKDARTAMRKAFSVGARGAILDRERWAHACRAMYVNECRREALDERDRRRVSDVKSVLSTFNESYRGGDYFMFFGRDGGEEFFSLSPLDLTQNL